MIYFYINYFILKPSQIPSSSYNKRTKNSSIIFIDIFGITFAQKSLSTGVAFHLRSCFVVFYLKIHFSLVEVRVVTEVVRKLDHFVIEVFVCGGPIAECFGNIFFYFWDDVGSSAGMLGRFLNDSKAFGVIIENFIGIKLLL